MSDTVVESLILDPFQQIAKQDRTYEEVMDAWRTSCPKLPVWEDANDREFVIVDIQSGRKLVKLTPAGTMFLSRHRVND